MASHRPLYHDFAWAFDHVVADESGRRVRRLAALLRAHGVRPPARVLDAGCGTGN
jgi:predicted TPR repeat methyltransferase